jgi:ketosteroid isomerase-like protein
VTSEQNVEVVRLVYDGWARGDFSEGDSFHPDVEFDMTDWPGGGSARGVAGMRRAWGESLRAWENFRAEARDFIAGGDQVVVLTHATGRGTGSGLEVSADTATVWTLEEGKVVRLGLYWDVAKAFEAAGLDPPSA